jgi:hypothetical protein
MNDFILIKGIQYNPINLLPLESNKQVQNLTLAIGLDPAHQCIRDSRIRKYLQFQKYEVSWDLS